MSYIEIQCGDVLASVIFIIEGELQEIPQAEAINTHITTCGACAAEIEHERVMHQLLQDALKRTCDEQAPEDLHQSIHNQLRAQQLRLDLHVHGLVLQERLVHLFRVHAN